MNGPPRLVALALAFSLALGAQARSEGALRGSAYSSLGPDELAMRLSEEWATGWAAVGLRAKDEELGLDAALRLLASGEGEGRLVAGPGSASGPLRLLVDPTSPTALSRGDPVEIDASFESRGSVLELGAGALSLFALSKGRGMSRQPEAAAAGLEWARALPSGGLALVAAASRDGEVSECSGWRPDPSVAPASNALDPAEPCYGAALAADRQSAGGSSLFALAASYGRLAGPALALRLESREQVALCGLRLSAAAASPNFRSLAGSRLGRLLEIALRARLAMRRASSLEASLETEAKGGSLSAAPAWGRKGSVRLLLPLGPGRLLDSRIEGELLPEGEGVGTWALAFSSEAESEEASVSSRLGASVRWAKAFSGLGLELETAVAAGSGLPSLGLELSLGLLEGGMAASPVTATGSACLEVPFGKDSSLSLTLALPEEGLILAPSLAGSAEDVLFRFRYRYSERKPSSRRRPRSRSSGSPKAWPIVQRAAS